MSSLDTALVVLVSVWSIIFIIFGLAMIIILVQVKRALEKINHILQTADTVTEGVSIPLNAALSSVNDWIRNRSKSKPVPKKLLKKGR